MPVFQVLNPPKLGRRCWHSRTLQSPSTHCATVKPSSTFTLSSREPSLHARERRHHNFLSSILSIFWKKKICLMRSSRPCLWIPPSHQLLNGWTAMKLSIYIMALEPISAAHFTSPPISLCVYMYISAVARQRLGNIVTAATNTQE
jgi:hypothetical protein